MQVGLEDLALRPRDGRARAAGVRVRRARGGDAARLPRHRQGPARRHARLPQELPDDDLRLVRHAHGRRRRARLQDADVRRSSQAGHVPVISAMGNLPIVKDLVVDMEPFWEKFRSVDPWLQPGYDEPPDGKEHLITPGADERDPQGGALHQLRLLRLGVQRDGVRPGVPRPAGAREGRSASSATRATARKVERLEELNAEHGIWDCTRCYFCNERCPKGVDPRDAIAKLGAESMKRRDRPRHGREAREVVRHLGEDDGLAARDGARPEDAGHRLGDQADEVRDRPGEARQGAAAVPAARREGRRGGARALRPRPRAGPSTATAGIVQGERALAQLAHGHGDGDRDPYGEGSFPRPYLPEDKAPDEPEGSAARTRAWAR